MENSLLKPKNYYQGEKPQQHQEVPELFYFSQLLMKYYIVWFFFRCCGDGEQYEVLKKDRLLLC